MANFTNKPTATGHVVIAESRAPVKPYVSRGSYGSLTHKERIAREQAKRASASNTLLSQAGNFFSPQLSTDFLELPQSLRERRELLRHFYNTDELVGQAIDTHTELPLSKVRLSTPKPRTCPKGFDSPEDYGAYILSRFERMCRKVKLFQRLILMVHHYWLDGNCFIFAEDSAVEVPQQIGYDRRIRSVVTDEGEAVEEEEWAEKGTRETEELAYYAKHYEGWSKLIILPIDQVKITTYSFTDKIRVELIPSDRDRQVIEQAQAGDEFAASIVADMPLEVREHVENGKLIPLGTDPNEGSFVFMLSGRKGADDELGHSILERCLRNLMFREKLRQAQTSIASRAMTPKRLIWAEGLSDADVDSLREQVDLALVDPDFSIVTNYEVHWEDIGARDRLLDVSQEYEQSDRRLITGLGVTESLMSGESLYSGDRLKLEVINNRYLHLREVIQEYVHEHLFEPVGRRMGFVEQDKWGQEVVLYPQLSFTRLPLRDSQDTFDAMFNLYQKGSIPVEPILDLLNINAYDTRLGLEKDLFTVNDSTFNEILRSVYSEVGRALAEKSDIVEKIAKYLGLKMAAPAQEEAGRF